MISLSPCYNDTGSYIDKFPYTVRRAKYNQLLQSKQTEFHFTLPRAFSLYLNDNQNE